MLTKQKRLSLLKISYRPKVKLADGGIGLQHKMWAMNEKSKVDMYEDYVAPGGFVPVCFLGVTRR